MKIYIIIPCYNESATIAGVVRKAAKYGQVVVVNDGSSDNSHDQALEAGAIVINHFINRAMGAALETGNEYARRHGAEVVIHLDADGQHNPDEIPDIIRPIVEGQAEIVFGSRFLRETDNVPWIKRNLILKPAIVFQNSLYKTKLTDAHNGYRAMSKKALDIIRIHQDGMAHASEIVEKTSQHKLKYCEVPVTVNYSEFGQGFIGGLKILRDLFFGKFK